VAVGLWGNPQGGLGVSARSSGSVHTGSRAEQKEKRRAGVVTTARYWFLAGGDWIGFLGHLVWSNRLVELGSRSKTPEKGKDQRSAPTCAAGAGNGGGRRAASVGGVFGHKLVFVKECVVFFSPKGRTGKPKNHGAEFFVAGETLQHQGGTPRGHKEDVSVLHQGGGRGVGGCPGGPQLRIGGIPTRRRGGA